MKTVASPPSPVSPGRLIPEYNSSLTSPSQQQFHDINMIYQHNATTPSAMPNAAPYYGRIPVHPQHGWQESQYISTYHHMYPTNTHSMPHHDGKLKTSGTSESWKVSSSSLSQPSPFISVASTFVQHPSKPLPMEPVAPPPRHMSYPSQYYNSAYAYHPQLPHDTLPDPVESMWSMEPVAEYQAGALSDNDSSSSSAESYPYDNQFETSSKAAKNSARKEVGFGNNTTRQITVRSINQEYVVWITIEPTETGVSLAEKIHTIATFRTRKILSITTASGRQITIDHRPVFGSWMDMEGFEHGERWTVVWGDLDKGMMDKFFSKMIQVKSNRRRDNNKK